MKSYYVRCTHYEGDSVLHEFKTLKEAADWAFSYRGSCVWAEVLKKCGDAYEPVAKSILNPFELEHDRHIKNNRLERDIQTLQAQIKRLKKEIQ